MFEIFFDYTFQVILFGTMAIGAVSGALGCFAYLRKQSLIGDVIAHSSLFGIMLFFLISYWLTGEGSKSLLVIIPGAIFSGILALMLASLFSKGPRVREDSSLGVMLALFFGSGLFMLQAVQRAASIPGRRGLEGYLFGMAAAMTKSDLIMISIVGLLALSMMLFFWKELKLYAFDPLFSHTIGFHTFWMDLLMITLLVLGIVIGIQCVGVILMIALLITPAAAARQWTRSLGWMVFLAAVFGAMSSAVGSYFSAAFYRLPTGPIIVLAAVLILGVSILFAPARGLLWQKLKQRKASQTYKAEGST